MSKQHCMIEGVRCSKCCEVLTISVNKNMRECLSYVRRHGYPEDWLKDNKVVFHMIRRISKRRAKIKNPFLVKTINNKQSYFTCKNLKNGVCTDYENRPAMCSKYPNYSHSEQEWSKWVNESDQLIGLYRPDCTYYDKSFYSENGINA